jgi:hypothetical protein
MIEDLDPVRRLRELAAGAAAPAGALWAVRIEPADGLPRAVRLTRGREGDTDTVVIDTGRERWMMLESDFVRLVSEPSQSG